jgi:hypothetical protein
MKLQTPQVMRTVLFLALVIIISSAFISQQSTKNKYLTMRTYQAAVGNGSKILIVYEDGRSEEIELEKYTVSNFLPNTIKINNALNDLSKGGYELVSVTGAELVSLYTFVKK